MLADVRVISESDLQHVKKVGRRIRACCPIHNSQDRDLSLIPYSDDYLTEEERDQAGFGYCHGASCHAVVLVKEWNPGAAARLLGKPVEASEPRMKMSGEELEQAEAWQCRELAALTKIYGSAVGNLKHLRAYAYLAQRGLGNQEALDLLEHLGVGYIPAASAWKKKPPFELARWCDRIIFPFQARGSECGYVGRTLQLWEPGMDEGEHKRLLDEHDRQMGEEHGKDAGQYPIRRWLKTYRSGFFHGQIMGEHRHVYVTEGAFDAISLMLAGLPNVIAVAGTHFDVDVIPKRVLEMTLAFDADTQGKNATNRVLDLLGGTGITAQLCTPPADGLGKDWSERYRRCGLAGLAVLLYPTSADEPDAVKELVADQVEEGEDEISGFCACGAEVEYFDVNGLPYCSTCLPTSAVLEPEEAEEEQEIVPAYPLTKEEIIGQITGIFGECVVEEIPKGYRLSDHIQREAKQRQLDKADKQAAYWRKLRAKLGDFQATLPPEMAAQASRPHTYPAPFPAWELYQDAEGIYHQRQIGIWPADGGPMIPLEEEGLPVATENSI